MQDEDQGRSKPYKSSISPTLVMQDEGPGRSGPNGPPDLFLCSAGDGEWQTRNTAVGRPSSPRRDPAHECRISF